jgi:hypothetical protein
LFEAITQAKARK